MSEPTSGHDPDGSNPMARPGPDPDATTPLPVTPAEPEAAVPEAAVPEAAVPEDAAAAEAEATVAEPVAPRPSPGPRHAAAPEEPTSARHPRRWFLAGAGAAVLAGAAGVGAALLRDDPAPTPDPAPAPLLAAIATERSLLADLDATTGGTPQVRRILVQARADHAAHLQALLGVAAAYDPPTAASSSPPARGTARSAAQLRAAEARAATVATERAVSLDGRAATLLASIAACEASHAELL